MVLENWKRRNIIYFPCTNIKSYIVQCNLYGIPTLPGLERRMKVNGQKRRREKKKEEEEEKEEDKVSTATLEQRKMSEKILTMDKEMESIARDDEDGTNTTNDG